MLVLNPFSLTPVCRQRERERERERERDKQTDIRKKKGEIQRYREVVGERTRFDPKLMGVKPFKIRVSVSGRSFFESHSIFLNGKCDNNSYQSLITINAIIINII